jgi:hypothetical protein
MTYRAFFRAALAAVSLAALAAPAAAQQAAEVHPRRLDFPTLADGRLPLAVDLHTHSVFSDGLVWPDIRVEEARRDGLYGLAVTEHIEYQPRAADLPHPDRTRTFAVARATEASTRANAAARGETPPPELLVINGAEVTRDMPPGHVNAVFLSDVNALNVADPMAAFEAARAQDAFIFWNHPYWTVQAPDGVARLDPMHRDLIARGLIEGIEVANGADYSEEAFRIALDNNLTVLGTSDIHGLVDWEYDFEAGVQRTATLALAREATPASVKAALRAGETVAVFKGALIGRREHVEAVVRSSLKIAVGQPIRNTTTTPVRFINAAPVDFLLERLSAPGFYDGASVFRVPARSEVTLIVKNAPDPAAVSVRVRALNAYVGPAEHLELTLDRAATP